MPFRFLDSLGRIVAVTATRQYKTRPRDDGKFASRIRKLRLQQGYTQVDIAKLTGTDERTVRGWEYGRSVPHAGPALRALATVLRVTPGFLLFGKEFDADGDS
jgi:transcriptional regulator with XRE-family HTH domain